MKFICFLCLFALWGCSSFNGHSLDPDVAFDSMSFGRIHVYSKKVIQHEDVCFEIKLHMKNVEQKEILRTYDEHIAQLQHTFSVNVQKTVQTYEYVVTDSAFLKGLPDHCVAYTKKEAEKRGHANAWVFTLEGPVLMDVLQHAEHPTLRKALWFARQTQASSGPYDNRPVLRTLVETRHKRAQLFGYASHAEYVLSARMAKTKEAVLQ
jgi:peptidyl-dipeptidase Dcp